MHANDANLKTKAVDAIAIRCQMTASALEAVINASHGRSSVMNRLTDQSIC